MLANLLIIDTKQAMLVFANMYTYTCTCICLRVCTVGMGDGVGLVGSNE